MRPRERNGVAPSRKVSRAACHSRCAPAASDRSIGGGRRKIRRANALLGRRVADEVSEPSADGDNIVHRSDQRAEQMNVVRVGGQQHPITVAATDDRSGGQGQSAAPVGRPRRAPLIRVTPDRRAQQLRALFFLAPRQAISAPSGLSGARDRRLARREGCANSRTSKATNSLEGPQGVLRRNASSAGSSPPLAGSAPSPFWPFAVGGGGRFQVR